MDMLLALGFQAAMATTDWEAQGRQALEAAKARESIEGPAKNVILFIADGMDVTTSTAARILDGQQKGGSGEENLLTFESLPFTGFAKTYNTNAQVPDSAGTATAMMTGFKTKAGVINVDETVPVGDCEASKGHELESLMRVAQRTGRASGVVSTARITHATPATVYANAASRNWEGDANVPEDADCADIASQLIAAASEFDLWVAMGGGRRFFMTEEQADPEYPTAKGARQDGRDLTAEWEAISRRHKVVTGVQGFEGLGPRDKVLGLFEPSHMKFEHDRAKGQGAEPSLAQMTRFAIERLSRSRNGFFLMVEGGRVDHAHHGGNAYRALVDTIAFDAAVETALDLTDAADTLVIVTADHGHTMAFGGYPQRGNPITGLVRSAARDGSPSDELTLASDAKPFTTLSYANGPGSVFAEETEGRPALTEEEVLDPGHRQQALVPLYSETHGGQDVAVYARGPSAHYLTGVNEQTHIYYVMEDVLTRRD